MSERGPRIALTFDAEHPDRPRCDPGNAERILGVLREAEVRATFFVQGRWALANPGTARRIAEDGHLVGHHSHHHAPMTSLSEEGLRQDLEAGERAIRETAGADPRPWFRCPFGAGHDDPRVLRALSEVGYRNVHWHVEVEDWEPWRSPEAVAEDALRGALAHGDGAVVLLHTWPDATAAGLPALIAGLREAGARPVSIADLEVLP